MGPSGEGGPETTRSEANRKGPSSRVSDRGRSSTNLGEVLPIPRLVRAALLGVHAVIRLGELLVHVLAGIADGQADGNPDFRVFGHGRRALQRLDDALPDPLACLPRAFGVGFQQNDQELVPAVAHDRVY